MAGRKPGANVRPVRELHMDLLNALPQCSGDGDQARRIVGVKRRQLAQWLRRYPGFAREWDRLCSPRALSVGSAVQVSEDSLYLARCIGTIVKINDDLYLIRARSGTTAWINRDFLKEPNP